MTRFFIARDGRLRATWRFLLGVVGVVAAEYGSAFLAGFLAGPDAPRLFVFLQEPLSLVFALLIFCLLLTLADHVDHSRLRALGLPRFSGSWRQWLDGILLGAGMVTLCVMAIRTLGGASFTVDFSGRNLLAVALVFGLLLIGATKEEVAFRGYPFQRLVEAGGRRWGPILGITVLSLLFGLVHWNNPNRSLFSTANTILIGMVLAAAYLRTRALWLPIGIHFGWNFTLGVVYGLPVSGLNGFGVLIHGQARGPQWLTGGDYGIEASAAATVVMALALVAILRLYRPSAVTLDVADDRRPKPPSRVDASGPDRIQV